MLYLNQISGFDTDINKKNLTLTSVVFEFSFISSFLIATLNLTLTSVVFE